MKKLINPNSYITHKRKKGFEGWYFKITLEGKIFAFIVGVCKAKSDPHSFIQYIDGERSASYRFELSEFGFDKKDMTINIGGNTFSLCGIDARLDNADDGVFCDLKFSEPLHFDRSLYTPSAMGPFAYLPLPCAHIVVALNMRVSGTVKAYGKTYSGEGNGYIEKDYGLEFPKNYVWCHAHEQGGANGGVSIMFALAYPLIFGIRGFICIFYDGEKQHNLSLYNFAKLDSIMKHNSFSFFIKKGGCKLRAKVSFDADKFFALVSPEKCGMDGEVFENVSATMELEYTTKTNKGCVTIPSAFERRGHF